MKFDSKINRRKFITGSGSAALVAIAGCSGEGESRPDIEEVKREASKIKYSELMRNEDEYDGEYIVFTGKISQVLGDEDEGFQFRINVTETDYLWEDDVLVRWNGKRYLEDDIIEFWGQYHGLITYEAVLGNERTIPDITAYAIEIVE